MGMRTSGTSRCRFVAAFMLVACQAALAGTPLRVVLPADAEPVSGRLLVSVQPAAEAEKAAKDGKVVQVAVSPFGNASGTLAGMDVPALLPGKPLAVDTETQTYPGGMSTLPAGEYYLQATLDVARDNNYGKGAGDDIASAPVKIMLGEGRDLPLLALDQRAPAPGDLWDLPASASAARRAQTEAARPHIKPLDFQSPVLTAFWGRSIHMRGWVVLPPGYEGGKGRYPVAYWTHGFGGNLRNTLASAIGTHAAMASGATPPMIWVMLDQSSATGTHEFADSVNNGPWGTALTEELIPRIDREYRTDGVADSRFVTGHSSGGWAALWLQVSYPKVFGGSWPTAPDSSDFHDFTGPDLYAADANVYRRADGSAIPLVRNEGKVIATFEQFARLEEVTGPYGGQMASFEWVFSPRGADGRPMPMFDRRTGAVDPQVAAYWREHFDIAHRIATRWNTLKSDLDGKIHLIVGTADTFYLDGAARRLDAVMKSVGARADFRYLPGRTHFDLYTIGDDRAGLARTIAWEMYRRARPQARVPDDVPKPETEAAAH